MTTALERLGASAVTVLATSGVIVVALWIQRERDGWPFQPAPAASPEVAAAPAHAGGDATHDRVPVDSDSANVDRLDIRLETVHHEMLTQTVRSVATVSPDESRMSHVHTRVSGWVDQLEVNTTGQSVRAGQPLARIFSQELLASQTEYLAARRNAASGIVSAVASSGRTRLGVLGMTEDEIAAIEASGEPVRLVTVAAPRGGVVVHRGVTVGTAVDPSTELLTIADLSSVWILAEVAEADIPMVRIGSLATLDFPASGRPPFKARVEFVYPTLTERTRTLRVRLTADNGSGMLKPGLYGTATFESVGRRVLTVPRDAVVDTGLQQHVFVAAGDRYEPRAVTLGARLADRIEIRGGLDEGEQIVASGVFLLDSESRLRATGGATPAHSGHQGHEE